MERERMICRSTYLCLHGFHWLILVCALTGVETQHTPVPVHNPGVWGWRSDPLSHLTRDDLFSVRVPRGIAPNGFPQGSVWPRGRVVQIGLPSHRPGGFWVQEKGVRATRVCLSSEWHLCDLSVLLQNLGATRYPSVSLWD